MKTFIEFKNSTKYFTNLFIFEKITIHDIILINLYISNKVYANVYIKCYNNKVSINLYIKTSTIAS